MAQALELAQGLVRAIQHGLLLAHFNKLAILCGVGHPLDAPRSGQQLLQQIIGHWFCAVIWATRSELIAGFSLLFPHKSASVVTKVLS